MKNAAAMIQQPFETAAQKHLREGREAGEQTMLLRLLQCKFGPIAEEVQRRTLNLKDQDALLELGERLIHAKSLEELGLS